jgi:tetratricopeptide (TPR) repeat protein
MKEEKISMRPYIHILYIFLALLMASCNSAEKSLKKGDIAYNLGEYSDAAGHYKKAYSRYAPKEREQRGKVAYKMADCYRRFGFTSRALGAYKNAERYKYTDTLTYFYEGEMMRLMGDYKGAEKAYTLFLEKYPDYEPAQ